MTRFTVSFGSSSYVIRSVRPALYAGITTTTLGARTVSGIGRSERAALGPREDDELVAEQARKAACDDRVDRVRRGDPPLVPAGGQDLVERRRRGREALDREPGVGDQRPERALREEPQVRIVEDAPVDVVESPDEEQEADVEVGDVGHRDHHEAVRHEGAVELDEHAQRIHEVLQDVAVQDRVERARHVRDIAVEVGREHPLAVTRAGLRQRRVALEAGDAPAALREAPAHDTVGRPDIEDPPATALAEPLEDQRVAAVRVRLEDVSWRRAHPVTHHRTSMPQSARFEYSQRPPDSARSRTLPAGREPTILRSGGTVERRKCLPGAAHAACRRAGAQNVSRASGKPAPNARPPPSPLTTWTGPGRRMRAEALCSRAPSWTTRSPGRASSASTAASGRTELERANCAIPSPATAERNAIVAASATPTPSAAERRHTATASAALATAKRTAPRRTRGIQGSRPRAVVSRMASAAGGTWIAPVPTAAKVPATRTNRTSRGVSRARGWAEPGTPSIVSSHARATRSASAGNAGNASCGCLKDDTAQKPITSIPHSANRSQSRAVASSQGRRAPRASAHGSAAAHGRNASSVTTRNSAAESGASSSGKTRGRAKGSRWLWRSVDQRKPRLPASAARYQGRAIPTARSAPHHGIQGKSGRSRVSQKKSATTTSGPSAARTPFVSAARPRLA